MNFRTRDMLRIHKGALMKHTALHQKAKLIANRYKQCEQELVAIISQVDSNKSFYKLGYSSLFSYMTQALGLTESVACNISAVVRKAYQVPKLQEKVLSGEISLSKARKLTPVITKENQDQWLKVAETKTQKQIEREVALAHPKAAIIEKMNYVSSYLEIKEKVEIKQNIPRLKLELGVSEKLMLKLRRCQDLESGRQKKNMSLEECLEVLAQYYLEKKDPVKKAQRQKARGRLGSSVLDVENNAPASVSGRAVGKATKKHRSPITTDSKTKKKPVSPITVGDGAKKRNRRLIPAKIKHQVQLRDKGCCSYRDHNDKRCRSQRYLETHHKVPVAQGGKNTLDNLQLLCSGHHKMIHLR